MHNYKELKVWQKSIDLTVKTYKISMQFPDSERFNLTSQSRRCSVSVPSNIAEGAGRNTNGEFGHFLGIASGSSYELETQMIVAKRLGYMTESVLQDVCKDIIEVQKMIFSLQNKVKQG
jgi:four helix bundle protein